MKFEHKLIGIYTFILLVFVVYSYTQIDLNLTLSSNAFYQQVQQVLIQIGYYQRPISTVILIVILGSLFSFYFWILKLSLEKKVSPSFVKKIVVTSGILVFAYPAFSHDLFNYMFDARIVTSYGLDPSFFKALDFPLDPWIRFMRWTHRYYPYGPGWLMLTLIPSFLGMGKFVFTLLFFKLTFLVFHFANTWLIAKLADREKWLTPTLLYALNPLVLVESIISPHNEVMMLTGVLLAFYFFSKHAVISTIAFIVSVAIKFVSIILLPLFLVKKKTNSTLFTWSFWFWIVALVPIVMQREPYSWYMVPLIAFAALGSSRLITSLTIALSAALLIRYIPYIYYGDYSFQSQQLQVILFILTITAFFGASFLWVKKRFT